MSTFRKDQSGFSAVEVLLALIFVAIIAFIGVYVMHNRQQPAAKTATVSEHKSPAAPAAKPDPYAGWKTYSGQTTGVSLKYPSNYLPTPSDESVFLASTAAEQTKDQQCLARGECAEFELAISFMSFPKQTGETYLATLSRNGYQPTGLQQTKVDGHTAYESSDAQLGDAFSLYSYDLYIDLPERVVKVNSQFKDKQTLSVVKQIFGTLKVAEQ